MEFNMMAGYGDYNWSLILWLFIGLVILIVIINIAVRMVNKNRTAGRREVNIEQDVLKERKTRRELSKEDSKGQKKDSRE